MAKKKTDEVVGNIKLVCNKWKWAGFKPSCDKILSVQNCLHFFGEFQRCDCFEMTELDIKERELEKIEKMITETQNPSSLEIENIEVKVDNNEPPLKNKPKKKRRRRRKLLEQAL